MKAQQDLVQESEKLTRAIQRERELWEEVELLADKVGWDDAKNLHGLEMRLMQMREEEDLKDMECMF